MEQKQDNPARLRGGLPLFLPSGSAEQKGRETGGLRPQPASQSTVCSRCEQVIFTEHTAGEEGNGSSFIDECSRCIGTNMNLSGKCLCLLQKSGERPLTFLLDWVPLFPYFMHTLPFSVKPSSAFLDSTRTCWQHCCKTEGGKVVNITQRILY